MNNRERSAVVTGTSSGIGLAIAQRLLHDGWQVCGFDIAAPVLDHPAFSAVTVDLRDGAATEAAALRARGAAAFVHAAGVMRAARLGELDAADAELMWQLHVAAASRIAKHLVPAMEAGASVVLLGSRVAQGMAGRSQYAATKAALVALARSWAAEVVAAGVTVNVVSPAATETPMLRDPARQATAPRLPPLGRLIQPAEVAAMVSFLLSEDARAITGQEIQICGGASLAA